MFVRFSEIASANLGYKSLQNAFYYVNQPTIDSFSIEERFLRPVYRMADLNSALYIQDPTPSQWLFYCQETENDLRGTGAQRYIDAMAERPATTKKQSGKAATIREVLSAQSGGRWYSPKARPNKHHIWLRKGVSGVFSPFLFSNPATIDQRCNSVAPVEGVEWEEVAAVLTSSLFTFSSEINGSISMGAGVLEVTTSKLRDYPIFDVRSLSVEKRGELVELAKSVWRDEKPVDWTMDKAHPGSALEALDKWLLQVADTNITTRALYADISAACSDRINLASGKVKTSKIKRTENIGAVAERIAESLRFRLRQRNFPDDFATRESLDTQITISNQMIRKITLAPFMSQSEITVEGDNRKILFKGQYESSVSEAIARALLWKRTSFWVSLDAKIMHSAVGRFIEWGATFEAQIEEAVITSALGTGYEDALRKEVFRRLGIDPMCFVTSLPTEMTFTVEN